MVLVQHSGTMGGVKRTCKRCLVEQARDQFAPEGYVCRTCKLAAVEKRERRNPRGRPRKYATPEEARAAKRAYDVAYRSRRVNNPSE